MVTRFFKHCDKAVNRRNKSSKGSFKFFYSTNIYQASAMCQGHSKKHWESSTEKLGKILKEAPCTK